MKKRIFLSVVLAMMISFASCNSIGSIGTRLRSAEELKDYGYVSVNFDCSKEIIAIDTANIPDEGLDTAICLQGIVAKTSPSIFIIINDAARKYLAEYEKSGCTVVYNDENGEPWTLKTLIEKYTDKITDKGYTLYRVCGNAEGLNVACNYATAYGWLAFPENLKSLAEECGLVLKKDFSTINYDYAFQLEHFELLKEHFVKSAIVHIKSNMHGLRDWAIQQGFFICFSENTKDGEKFMKKILSFTGKNTAVFGWANSEEAIVTLLSKHSSYITPSDHSFNNSYIGSFDFENTKQPHSVTKTYNDPTKHYAAIVFSDGDNSQWVQNGFNEYYQKLELDYDFPMTWTFPLIQQEISSVSKKLAYESATENNYFIGGVSGIGYMNPSDYDKDNLPEYIDRTVAAMLRSDMSIVAVLDWKPDKNNYFDYYAASEHIKGGIVQYYPNRYAAGKGRVWFAGDKPFVSVRFSLWHPSGEMEKVTKEWVEEMAAVVNSYKADINSINGYSVINVHPWTINTENFAYFVSLLDEHIQLVTADELIKMITDNCPHKDAKPDK